MTEEKEEPFTTYPRDRTEGSTHRQNRRKYAPTEQRKVRTDRTEESTQRQQNRERRKNPSIPERGNFPHTPGRDYVQ